MPSRTYSLIAGLITIVMTSQPTMAWQDPVAKNVESAPYDHIAGGWRYTRDGWEQASSWDMVTTGTAIGTNLLAAAPAERTEWVQALGSTHPTLIAGAQLSLVLVLMNVGVARQISG